MPRARRRPGSRAPRRLVRAAGVAFSATALGGAGHLLGGGSIRPALLLLAAGLAVVATWSLAGRERGWLTVAATQVGLQQVAHLVLAAGVATDGAGLLPHDLMLQTHVLAGCLMATLLRAGERRIWATARRLAAGVTRWCRDVLACPAVPVAVAAAVPAPVRSMRLRCPLRHAVVLRGPPVPVA